MKLFRLLCFSLLLCFVFPILSYADQLEDAKAAIQNEDFTKAHELLLPLGEENNAEAQVLLGFLYINGQGVEKDDIKGLSLIMKSARQGYVEARSRAIAICLDLANQGDASAMYNLGYMYLHGWGGEQDTDIGIGWLESAAKNGHVLSAKVLSGIYAEGTFGITPDEDKASFWSNLPAEFATGIDETWSGEALDQGGPTTEPTFDSDAGEWIMEDITVIGQNSIGRLRYEVDRAVDRMYKIYNELNTDDDFDIRCVWNAPTGSRIKRKLCTPVYVKNLQARATQYALYDMDNSGITSIYIDYTQIAIKDAKLRENMKRLILENPSLFDAVVEHVKLREELKRQRQIYWGLEED
jgi:hypothetical protein